MEIRASWIAAVCYVLISLTIYSDAESARKKDRDVSGLYPFPRVGRRDNFDAAFTDIVENFEKPKNQNPSAEIQPGKKLLRASQREFSYSELCCIWSQNKCKGIKTICLVLDSEIIKNLLRSANSEFIKRQGLIPFPRVGRTNIKPKPEGPEIENWVERQPSAFSEKPNEWSFIQLQGSPPKTQSNAGKDKEARGLESSNVDSNEPYLPSQIMAW